MVTLPFFFVLQTVQSMLPPPMHKVLDPKRASIHPTDRMVHLVAVSQPSTFRLLWSAAPTGWPRITSLVHSLVICHAPALAPPEPPPLSRSHPSSHPGAPPLTHPLLAVVQAHLPPAPHPLHFLLRMAVIRMAGEQPGVCYPGFSPDAPVRSQTLPSALPLILGHLTQAQMKPRPLKSLL